MFDVIEAELRIIRHEYKCDVRSLAKIRTALRRECTKLVRKFEQYEKSSHIVEEIKHWQHMQGVTRSRCANIEKYIDEQTLV